jgi:glutamate N-acetyltransferase/amino-acid N-acetyltransferase
VAGALGASAADVAVCSTGLIGERLPMDLLLPGATAAVHALSDRGGDAAATAIMTTDTVAKQALVQGDGWSVGGMAKGAGMLAPGLATMLVVLTTDADVAAGDLDSALRGATRVTFDRVDSDGCMSTNDTVLLLASGASGVRPDPVLFSDVVRAVCADLAGQLLDDAEGSTKTIEVEVVHAATEEDALEAARAVARSNLVKCAIHGEDANWGRVLAAVGTTRAAFEPHRLAVAVNGVQVCRDGAIGEDRSTVDLSGRAVTVTVDLGAGPEHATVWTNDLTADYVHENAAYST